MIGGGSGRDTDLTCYIQHLLPQTVAKSKELVLMTYLLLPKKHKPKFLLTKGNISFFLKIILFLNYHTLVI
jgi:hypothetical protein